MTRLVAVPRARANGLTGRTRRRGRRGKGGIGARVKTLIGPDQSGGMKALDHDRAGHPQLADRSGEVQLAPAVLYRSPASIMAWRLAGSPPCRGC